MESVEEVGGALVVQGEMVPDQIAVRRDPALVLAEATKAAKALKSVMDGKAKKVVMNGEQYIENEDWVTIARFYGLTVKLESDAYCQYGDAKGFEATCVVVDVNGIERGRATMMCLDDEDKWGERNKYGFAYVLKDGTTTTDEPANPFQACQLEPTGKKRDDGSDVMRPKKIKALIGTEKTPLFQLRSMAQTRASSKALNMLLKFVPVLAGYRPTPAEELDGQTQTVDAIEVSAGAGRSTQAQTQQTQQTRPAQTTQPSGGGDRSLISAGQITRLWAITRDLGRDEDKVAEALKAKYKVESTKEIKKSDYDAIIESIRDGSILK